MIKYPYLGNGYGDSHRLDIPTEILLAMHRSMLRIRRIEEEIENRYHDNEMKTPIHLVIGQEATSVGAALALRKEDHLFSSHRTHGNYLAKGGDLKAMLAEMYCRSTGCVGSRGGSMHLLDKSVGMAGSSAICGGIIPIATGAALNAQMKKNPRVTMAFLGDGAAEEGAVWESFNFASLKKLPVIYFCENNFYSVCSPLDKRQPETSLQDKARSFGLNSVSVDGMNVMSVYTAAKQAWENALNGQGPQFIEAKVYRFRGHGGSGDDSHTGYRTKAELKSWEELCPVQTFQNFLISQKLIDARAIVKMELEIAQEIHEAFAYAIASPVPHERDLFQHVYA